MKEIINQRAVTLIALVVTIIVLLILAGVTVSMTLGQSGISNKATTAKEKTEINSYQEELEVIKTKAKGAGYDKQDDQIMQDYVNRLKTSNTFKTATITTSTENGETIVNVTINGYQYKVTINTIQFIEK